MSRVFAPVVCMVCGKPAVGMINGKQHRRSIKGMCVSCYMLNRQSHERQENKKLYGNIYGSLDSSLRVSNQRRCVAWSQRIRNEAIVEYGSQCTHCGETETSFLTIDHIHNDGREERRYCRGFGGAKLYKSLKDRGYPKDNYQLLCWNCNIAKSHANVVLDLSDGRCAQKMRSVRRDVRQEAILAYGGKCECCGEANSTVLTVAFIGDRATSVDRHKYRNNGYGLCNNLRRLGFPRDGYRLLCYNCNKSRLLLGTCAHRRGIE